MRFALCICILLGITTASAQGLKNTFVQIRGADDSKYPFIFLDNAGDTVLKLDSALFYACFTDTTQYFVVVAPANKRGWWAIDMKGHFLFKVFNAGYGEPDPDQLTDGMIRIIDDKGKVGFADEEGKVIVKPQFDDATPFYKGHAIVSRLCKKIYKDDEHSSLFCKQNGYINKHGKIMLLGNYSDEELLKKLNSDKPNK